MSVLMMHSLNAVARVYELEKHPSEAACLYKIVCRFENVLFVNTHMHRSSTLRNLARVLQQLGQFSQARDLTKKAEEIEAVLL